jgi:hypothetical protein
MERCLACEAEGSQPAERATPVLTSDTLTHNTGHDLNDFQALQDGYDWLVDQTHLRREPILR